MLRKSKEKNFIKIKSVFSKSLNFIKDKINLNDIIQIEYWPHPLLIKICSCRSKKSTNGFILLNNFSRVNSLIHEKF